MKAFCDHCQRIVQCDSIYSRNEAVTVRHHPLTVEQQYAICPYCGDEVYPNAVIDFNVQHAHDAYRTAVGSITTTEIRRILEKYNIGAQPMSKLLGWGDNTIDRQMRHTIPDREHARRLRELDDPAAMKKLLIQNRCQLSPVTYKKAMDAVEKLLERNGEKLPMCYNTHKSAWPMSVYAALLP